jgi:hypothetical protein
MHREDLPDGQWAMIRDREEITRKGKRSILVIASQLASILPQIQGATDETDMADLPLTEAQADAMMRLSEASVVALLAEWSLPDPLPTLDTVGDMPATLFEALEQATAKDAAVVAATSLDMAPGGGADPKGSSGDSAPLSTASKGASVRKPTPR